MSEAEIIEVVSYTLMELANKEQVPLPQNKSGRHMVHRRGVITFDMPIMKKFWVIDKEKAKIYLRHSLAHEFYHYLQFMGKRPSTTYFKDEPFANKYAEDFVGMSYDDFEKLSDDLWESLPIPKKIVGKPSYTGQFKVWWDKLPIGKEFTFSDMLAETGIPKGSLWAIKETLIENGKIRVVSENKFVKVGD